MKILTLIPARGGSRGIPRKNIKWLADKPLIAWTIEAALKSRYLNSIVVSTEDEEIAEIAQQWGAKVPFLRPTELAQDDTPGIDPILHALEQLPQFDAVMVLQPTSPLRTTQDINACIHLAQNLHSPSVVSVTKPAKHPYWMYQLGPSQQLQKLMDVPAVSRRQDLPPVYALNGALYFAQVDWLRQHRTFVTDETIAYMMPRERSLDLDTLLDWKWAELLIKGGL